MPGNPTTLVSTLMVSFVAWRMYRRLRQHVGRQELKTKRIIFRVAFYCVLSLVFVVFSLGDKKLLTGWGSGVLIGLPLAWLGFNLTRFETTPQGHFYTPNPFLGIAMSLLLVGRLIYRIAAVYGLSDDGGGFPRIVQTPLTLFTFELVASYFAAYYLSVLFRCHAGVDGVGPAKLPPS